MSEIIKKSPLDEVFRQSVLKFIDSARKEIIVITGEVGAFKYWDLRLGAKSARERGVAVKIYATNPPQGILNKLLMYGCEVYVGKKSPEKHYMVIDANSWVFSEEHPPGQIGVRSGSAHKDDPRGAKKIIKLFNSLVTKAKKVERPDWEKDPLWLALKDPPDWSVETDSSKLDEEFIA